MSTANRAHGTWSMYIAGCRLECCRSAARAYQKLRVYERSQGRTRTVDATGTHRRIEALVALGWSYTALATRLGMTRDAIRQMHIHPVVWRSTSLRFAALYDEMAMTLPPEETATQRAMVARVKRKAVARGWVPPLAWDDDTIDDPTAVPVTTTEPDRAIDEVAVRRALDGGTVDLTKAERLVVIAQLAAEGMSDVRIAERVGVTERTVHRDRAAAGIESRWVA